MNLWASLLILIRFVAADAHRRDFHRITQATYSFMEINTEIRIGTPEVDFTARLDSTIPHTVIMDDACHEPQLEYRCPRYCKDSVIKLVFCSPLCESVSQAETLARCFRTNLYHSNKSTTFFDMREEVTSTFRATRPLLGRRAQDHISLITQKVDKAQNMEGVNELWSAIEGKNVEFVRGFSYDLSKLYGMSAIIGLAPIAVDGELSLIPQLKKMGILRKGILTVQMPNPPLFMSPFQYVQTSYSMIVGGLDGYHCRNWRSFPTYDGLDWNFEMSSVRLFGQRFPGPNVGRIDLAESFIVVPRAVVAHFVAAKFIKVDNDTKNLYLSEPTDLSKITLDFTVGTKRITIDKDWLWPGRERPMLTMKEGEKFRYTDEPRWSFGVDMFKYFCYGYDYDKGAVLWGDRRIIRINKYYKG